MSILNCCYILFSFFSSHYTKLSNPSFTLKHPRLISHLQHLSAMVLSNCMCFPWKWLLRTFHCWKITSFPFNLSADQSIFFWMFSRMSFSGALFYLGFTSSVSCRYSSGACNTSGGSRGSRVSSRGSSRGSNRGSNRGSSRSSSSSKWGKDTIIINHPPVSYCVKCCFFWTS